MQSNEHIVFVFDRLDGDKQMLRSDKIFKTLFSTLCLRFTL